MKQIKIKYLETNKNENTTLTRGWRWEKWGHVSPSVQTSSCKMNKFWGSDIQHGDYS